MYFIHVCVCVYVCVCVCVCVCVLWVCLCVWVHVVMSASLGPYISLALGGNYVFQAFFFHSWCCIHITVELHWASKETYHFFRATLTKIHCIKINHIWTQISYSYPYLAHLKKKKRFAWVKKETNAVKSQEVSFPNSQKLFASRPGSLLAPFVVVLSDQFDFVWFWKMTFCDFTAFFSSCHKQTFIFSDVLIKEY